MGMSRDRIPDRAGYSLPSSRENYNLIIMLLQILLSCIGANFFPFYVHSISLTTLEYPCKLNEKLEGSICKCILECGVGMEHDSECEICVPCGGATYSDEVSTDTCQPCSGCYTGEETYRDCTTESDTKCICRGYLTEAHLCKPCTECSDTQQETEDCTLKHDRKCEVKPTPESKPKPEPNQETKDGLTISEIAAIVSIPTSILGTIIGLVPYIGWCCNIGNDESTSSFCNYWKKYMCCHLHCCNCCKRRIGQIQGCGQDSQVTDMKLSEIGILDGNAHGDNRNSAVVGATPSGEYRPLVSPEDNSNDDDNDGNSQPPIEDQQILIAGIDFRKDRDVLYNLDEFIFQGDEDSVRELARRGGVKDIKIADLSKDNQNNAKEFRYLVLRAWAEEKRRTFQDIVDFKSCSSKLIDIAKDHIQAIKKEESEPYESNETEI